MENYTRSHCHIQTGGLVSVLRDVDKVVTNFLMHGQDARSLVPHEECSTPQKWVFMHWLAICPDFHSANRDVVFLEKLLRLCK